MITSFGALYAGYIDLEHVGYESIPANDCWSPNDRLREVFDNARDLAQLLEHLGYEVFWTAEHHFQREGYECIPNVLLLNVYLASQTTRIKLGCAFNIIPMKAVYTDQLARLAEEVMPAFRRTTGRLAVTAGHMEHIEEGAVNQDSDRYCRVRGSGTLS